MSISFNQIPSGLRTPFFAVEFDNSEAQQGPSILAHRVLLIGQMTSGTATANGLHQVTSPNDVITLAGRGSMLHRMALAYFADNKSTETWIGVLADNAGGVQATGTLTVTGTATAAGTLSLYLGGTLVQVAVASGDVQNTIATNIVAAITANADLPVTAAAVANVVTVTFRHKGAVGNEFDMRLNYEDGDATPAGVSVAIVAMASGATNPVLTTLIANMGDQWFTEIAHPYTDGTSLTAIETEMVSRAGPMRMIDGIAITAKQDTFGNLTTLGNGRNSQYSTIFEAHATPTPSMEVAANFTGLIAYYAAIDPARPFQTLPSSWVKAPAVTDRFTLSEKDLLLHDGISTTSADAGGVVRLGRAITTYKTNSAGASDTSYLDVTTIENLMYLRFDLRNRFLSKYPRHKLAADGTRVGPGQAILTPKLAKGEVVAWFTEKMEQGLVQNLDQFKADLVVEQDASNVNQLNFLVPPTLMDQFVVGAAKIQFRL